MQVRAMTGEELGNRVASGVPDAVQAWDDNALWVDPVKVADIGKFLFDDPDLDFQFLNSITACLLYTSPSPRDATLSRMPSSA